MSPVSGGEARVPLTRARRVLVTGPVDGPGRGARGMKEWCGAAQDAGWEALEWPLVSVRETDVDLVQRIDGLPDWIALTSSSAAAALERAGAALPELRGVPVGVVGERSAERVRAAGFRVAPAPAATAAELAARLSAELEGPEPGRVPGAARVLWPRGPLSSELAELLRAAGVEVDDPIVYTVESIEHEERAPSADAVFFASPSAVRAWKAREGPRAGATAVAIGATTSAALAELPAGAFARTAVIAEPEPAELGRLLSELAAEEEP